MAADSITVAPSTQDRQPIKVTATVGGSAAVQFEFRPAVPAPLVLAPRQIAIAPPPGNYEVIAIVGNLRGTADADKFWDLAAGKIKTLGPVAFKVTAGNVPDPPPGPGPVPVPTKLSVAIMDAADRSTLTPEQVGAVIDTTIQRALADGQFFRRYPAVPVDADGKTPEEFGFFQPFAGQAQPQLVIAQAGETKPLFSGTFATKAELLKILAEKGGVTIPAAHQDILKMAMNAAGANVAAPAQTKFGLLPRNRAKALPRAMAAADTLPVIPRAKWPKYTTVLPVGVLRQSIWDIKDQDGLGSCTSNATAQTLQILREQAGLPRVQLSPSSIYCNVAPWPRDVGSDLYDNLDFAMQVGIAPTSVVDANEWSNPSKWDAAWKVQAKQFRIVKAVDLDGDFDKVASAIILGYPVNIGVDWPGGGGHSICAVGLVQNGQKWSLLIANSWSDSWGDGGFGQLTEVQCKSMPNYGSWAAVECVYSTAL